MSENVLVSTEVPTKVLPTYRLPFKAEIPFTLRVFFLLLLCNLLGGIRVVPSSRGSPLSKICDEYYGFFHRPLPHHHDGTTAVVFFLLDHNRISY